MSGGLFHTLGVGSEALHASRQGVDTSSHNIANAHTDGYSKQRVNVTSREPSLTRGLIIGNGVFAKNIERAHDKFLERQLVAANQHKGKADGRLETLSALEQIYSPDLNSSVSDEITNFFNSLHTLSNTPEEPGARTHVRESGVMLINSFKRVEDSLRREQENINEKVKNLSSELTERVQRLAQLNVAIGDMETGRQDYVANDLRDEQERILRELSQELDINYYYSKDGLLVVRGPRDTLLVEGRNAASITTESNVDNGPFSSRVVIRESSRNDGIDITDVSDRGRMAAFLDVRDNVIDDLISHNENMARTLIDKVNETHRRGFGLNDFRNQTGRDFFQAVDQPGEFVRSLSISDSVVDSLDAISAASSPNAPGDNVIVNELLRIKDQPIMKNGTATFSQYYANYVGELGVDLVASKHKSEAEGIILGDLQARRESVAGVSMDEEAMNLLKWQANFAAASKVITTTDEMMETVLGLKR